MIICKNIGIKCVEKNCCVVLTSPHIRSSMYMYQGLGQMLTKCLQHHQGCPETPKNADVICERLHMLWTLWDLKYHFWNILFCHRHTGSIGSSVVWVVPSDRRAQQADPQLTMSPYYWPQKSPESYLPSGSQGPERRLGHLERGGAQEIGDQLLTRVSNLALSNDETGIVKTDHSVR